MSVNIFRKDHVPEKNSKTGKGSGYSISERFLTAMELPGDLAYKAPIITITGPAQVLIEYYKSILTYTIEQLITRPWQSANPK